MRGSAEFDAGSTQAVTDRQQALRLEPRQFDAFESLSRIAEQKHDWKGAYDAG